jgi:hypothetical protein
VFPSGSQSCGCFLTGRGNVLEGTVFGFFEGMCALKLECTAENVRRGTRAFTFSRSFRRARFRGNDSSERWREGWSDLRAWVLVWCRSYSQSIRVVSWRSLLR